MKCPKGHDAKQLVTESRPGDGYVYRRRYCTMCGCSYKTREEIFTGPIPQHISKPKRSEAQAAKDRLFERKSPW